MTTVGPWEALDAEYVLSPTGCLREKDGVASDLMQDFQPIKNEPTIRFDNKAQKTRPTAPALQSNRACLNGIFPKKNPRLPRSHLALPLHPIKTRKVRTDHLPFGTQSLPSARVPSPYLFIPLHPSPTPHPFLLHPLTTHPHQPTGTSSPTNKSINPIITQSSNGPHQAE